MKFKWFLVLIIVVFLSVQFNFLIAQIDDYEDPLGARKAWFSLKNSKSLKVLKVSKFSRELCLIKLNDIKVLLRKSGITTPTTVYLRSKSGKIIDKLGIFNPVNINKKRSKSLVSGNGAGRSVRFEGPSNVRIQLKKFDDPLLIKKFDDPVFKKFNNYSLVFKNSKGITKGLLEISIILETKVIK